MEFKHVVELPLKEVQPANPGVANIQIAELALDALKVQKEEFKQWDEWRRQIAERHASDCEEKLKAKLSEESYCQSTGNPVLQEILQRFQLDIETLEQNIKLSYERIRKCTKDIDCDTKRIRHIKEVIKCLEELEDSTSR